MTLTLIDTLYANPLINVVSAINNPKTYAFFVFMIIVPRFFEVYFRNPLPGSLVGEYIMACEAWGFCDGLPIENVNIHYFNLASDSVKALSLAI
jgi:hypothetical protein